MSKKILLIGKNGKLGTYLYNELQQVTDIELFCPSHSECDLDNVDQLNSYISSINPSIIVHVAGIAMSVVEELKYLNSLNNDGLEYRNKLRQTNIIGTCNLVNICDKLSIRLIYTSSEYVFYGNETLYETTSPVRAKNLYGKTKICGEMLVQTLKNYLIVRPPLIRDIKFEYSDAYDNQYCSRQYVDIVAKKLCETIIENNTIGICHIVGNRKSMYEIALETNKNVNKVNMKNEFESILPFDSSLSQN